MSSRVSNLSALVAENLIRIMAEKGVSQRGLAKACGLSLSHLHGVVKHQIIPSVDLLGDLAICLRIDPVKLISREQEPAFLQVLRKA